MRNGDAYKIKKLIQTGTPAKDVLHRFRNEYSEAEIRKFFPVSASDTTDKPAPPKKKARKRLTATG